MSRIVWTNETWANWMIDNGVSDGLDCLILVNYNHDARGHLPIKVVAIAKSLKEELIVPEDGLPYIKAHYIKLSMPNSYAVSTSEPIRRNKKNKKKN